MLASCSHIVALVLLLFAYPHSARSSVSRVHLVAHDATTNNFLFRGGMPQTEGGAFDYANLTLAMRNAAAIEGNLTLPPSFYLQDISLLNEAENAGLLEAERRFFAQNDFLGQLLHWTKVGSGESPALFNSTERKKKALALDNWSLDRVPSTINNITGMLHTMAPASQGSWVIYIHCSAGSDRTGEIAGSYRMKSNANQTFMSVLDYDDQVAGRDIATLSKTALEWYCLYLMWSDPSSFGHLACPFS